MFFISVTYPIVIIIAAYDIRILAKRFVETCEVIFTRNVPRCINIIRNSIYACIEVLKSILIIFLRYLGYT